jgi:DnaJ-class molecular chaperone
LKCHGVIHRGCAVCQGSGYSPRHDCSHTAHTTTPGSGKGHGTFAIAAIPRSANSATQLCAYCNGTGKVPGSLLGTAEDCPLCGGKGQITPEPPSQRGGGWLWLMASLAFLGLMFG